MLLLLLSSSSYFYSSCSSSSIAWSPWSPSIASLSSSLSSSRRTNHWTFEPNCAYFAEAELLPLASMKYKYSCKAGSPVETLDCEDTCLSLFMLIFFCFNMFHVYVESTYSSVSTCFMFMLRAHILLFQHVSCLCWEHIFFCFNMFHVYVESTYSSVSTCFLFMLRAHILLFQHVSCLCLARYFIEMLLTSSSTTEAILCTTPTTLCTY